MRHPTHVTFSVFLSIFVYFLFPSLNDYILSVYWFIIAGFAALVPDLDHPHAYISKGNWEFLSTAIRKTSPHRGWTHSIVGALIFAGVSVIVFWYFKAKLIYSIPFFFGYISHLISDSLNPTGVNWLWPNETKYGIGVIRTGSEVEVSFQTLIILCGTALFFYDLIYRGGLILK